MSHNIKILIPVLSQCPECGHEIGEKFNYCMGCGANLAGYKYTCPACENQLIVTHEGYRYCGICSFVTPLHPDYVNILSSGTPIHPDSPQNTHLSEVIRKAILRVARLPKSCHVAGSASTSESKECPHHEQ